MNRSSQVLLIKCVTFILIVGIGVWLRFYFIDWNKEDFFQQMQVRLAGDEVGYDLAARQLIEKGIYGYAPYAYSTEPNAFTTPGYPLFLAACYLIFGYGVEPPIKEIQLTQLVMDAVTGIFLYLISLKLLRSFPISCILLILYYLHPSFILAPSYLLTETLYGAFFLLFVLLLVRYLDNDLPTKLQSLTLGLIFGVVVLIRPAIVPFLGLFLTCLIVFFVKKRVVLQSGLLILTGFITIMLPWWIRNLFILHKWVWLAEQAGNPLLWGTFPYNENPPIDVSNDPAVMKRMAMERIKEGFQNEPLLYMKWYTVGKIWILLKDIYSGFLGIHNLILIRLHRIIVIMGLLSWLLSLFVEWKNDRRIVWVGILIGISILVYLPFAPTSRYFYPVVPLSLLGVGWLIRRCSFSIIRLKKHNT
ncbi:hypothetical protein [Paenibacillus hexagrammi]|uniref:Glycosyltransferase RgtA/B/C/D-like domain-containing protein n=1 Tax=Paenibacillus hexagrammi TaxID=2908839 RepID=A0ABY3SPC1_9BACL|nr:hypothetical protein [Paenibacillus sp. YPD9-1]UJF35687.1 hypothetical protein L0M14_11705 [Paenibacillus sp. YPD9-1]